MKIRDTPDGKKKRQVIDNLSEKKIRERPTERKKLQEIDDTVDSLS